MCQKDKNFMTPDPTINPEFMGEKEVLKVLRKARQW